MNIEKIKIWVTVVVFFMALSVIFHTKNEREEIEKIENENLLKYEPRFLEISNRMPEIIKNFEYLQEFQSTEKDLYRPFFWSVKNSTLLIASDVVRIDNKKNPKSVNKNMMQTDWKFLFRTNNGNYFTVTYYLTSYDRCDKAEDCLKFSFEQQTTDNVKILLLKEKREDLYRKYFGSPVPNYIITK